MDRFIQILGSASSEAQDLFSFIHDLGFDVRINAEEHQQPALIFDFTQQHYPEAIDNGTPCIPRIMVKNISEHCIMGLDGYVGMLEYPWNWTEVLVMLQQHVALDPGIQSESQLGDWIDFSLGSSRTIFQSMRQFLRTLLAHSVLAPEAVHSIHYAICEILLNAMEHGNRFDPRKRVRGSYVLFADRLVVKIEDQGCGFFPDDVPDPTQQPFVVAEQRKSQGKRPGGYGLALAKKWMDISFSERGNTVLLTKAF